MGALTPTPADAAARPDLGNDSKSHLTPQYLDQSPLNRSDTLSDRSAHKLRPPMPICVPR